MRNLGSKLLRFLSFLFTQVMQNDILSTLHNYLLPNFRLNNFFGLKKFCPNLPTLYVVRNSLKPILSKFLDQSLSQSCLRKFLWLKATCNLLQCIFSVILQFQPHQQLPKLFLMLHEWFINDPKYFNLLGFSFANLVLLVIANYWAMRWIRTLNNFN